MRKMIEICGDYIDINEVYYVSRLFGDREWIRYCVRFKAGHEKEYYQERYGSSDHFPREIFIKLLNGANDES